MTGVVRLPNTVGFEKVTNVVTLDTSKREIVVVTSLNVRGVEQSHDH